MTDTTAPATATMGKRTANDARPLAPIALAPGAGEALWFLACLVTVKSSAETTGGQVAVLEHLAPRGAGSPLHVHRREDEWFYVLEGELAFWVGGQVIEAPAGAFVYGPRDVPHTFVVSSAQARFLLVTEPAGLESFMRALSEPAQQLALRPSHPKWQRSPPPRPRTASRSSDPPASRPDASAYQPYARAVASGRARTRR